MRRPLVLSLVLIASLLAIASSAPGQNPAAPVGHVIVMGRLAIKAGREQDFLKIVEAMTARVKREDKGGAWAGPIVQAEWRPLADTLEMVRLTPASAR